MRFGEDLALLLSATTQVPFMSPTSNAGANAGNALDFEFKTGPDVFSPVDLVTLPRPGAGLVSPDGQLVVVPVSTYDVKESKCVLLYARISRSWTFSQEQQDAVHCKCAQHHQAF